MVHSVWTMQICSLTSVIFQRSRLKWSSETWTVLPWYYPGKPRKKKYWTSQIDIHPHVSTFGLGRLTARLNILQKDGKPPDLFVMKASKIGRASCREKVYGVL